MEVGKFLCLSFVVFLFWLCGYVMGQSERNKLQNQVTLVQEQLLDYQIETNLKGYKLYQEGKFIGEFQWNEKIPLDSVIIADNE